MALIARNISVRFGSVQILRNVDFTAEAGSFSAIIGPNGSGKTTLLRAIIGEIPYEGRVSINGQDTRDANSVLLAKQRAVLAQSTQLAFPFTVFEVVRLGLTAGVATGDPSKTAELPFKALARVGLEGFEGRFYAELSGGEKQRVQLARVLAQIWLPVLNGQPRWLFLDEPVSSLDIGHQLMVMEIAADYAKAGGGVVAVMHDLNLTAMFAQNVMLLADGHCLASGAPGEVLTNTTLSTAYGCSLAIKTAPTDGAPWLLPQAAQLTQHRTPS
ncbi:heme ABC transporter ATP-binding protein [Cognatiyoonia sp. IB215182]|uniref:heme ABC transporter ATP-binding protein n=1 Tax=Cognatiyoonia sp. IB215182 TaxID=3097353 RepID=UPI002A13736F|nr:heme ABC transporter ATP-binding protein [Cognatiyoonia sp. IB215182]MDX8355252.1 heme ABC transporter ATP-binding protein [Cognatiyoonia sp. IB215182]